jgi:uncharacterized protein (DUF362 family)
MRPLVALVKSSDHYQGVRDSLRPLRNHIKLALSKISYVIIKINLVITRTPAYNKGVELATTPLEADFLVSIVRPKTHCSVGVTAGIKNVLVGAIQKYSMRKKIHRGIHIHGIMASIADFVYPHFTIVDGTVGMQEGGPVRGKEIRAGWSVSSFDALAADSLATFLMGFDVHDIGYLNLIRDKNMGFIYPGDDIEIICEKPENLVTPFKPHRNFKKVRLWR